MALCPRTSGAASLIASADSSSGMVWERVRRPPAAGTHRPPPLRSPRPSQAVRQRSGPHGCGRDPAVPRLNRDSGAPGKDIVQMQRAFVRYSVGDLRQYVVVASRNRFGQRRIFRHQLQELRGEDSIPRQKMLDPGNVHPAAGSQLLAAVPHRCEPVRSQQGCPLGHRRGHRASECAAGGVDSVLRHHPIGGELASGDHDEARCGVGNQVLTRQLGGVVRLPGQQGAQARPTHPRRPHG